MPSSYLQYAVSYRGDGAPDIWHRREDVFASIANYLAQSGWHGDENWGRGGEPAGAASTTRSPGSADASRLADWAAARRPASRRARAAERGRARGVAAAARRHRRPGFPRLRQFPRDSEVEQLRAISPRPSATLPMALNDYRVAAEFASAWRGVWKHLRWSFAAFLPVALCGLVLALPAAPALAAAERGQPRHGAAPARHLQGRQALSDRRHLVLPAEDLELRRDRHRLVVWRAIPRPIHRQWRGLRSERADRRARHPADAEHRAGDQSRQRPHLEAAGQRPRALCARPHHRRVAPRGAASGFRDAGTAKVRVKILVPEMQVAQSLARRSIAGDVESREDAAAAPASPAPTPILRSAVAAPAPLLPSAQPLGACRPAARRRRRGSAQPPRSCRRQWRRPRRRRRDRFAGVPPLDERRRRCPRA